MSSEIEQEVTMESTPELAPITPQPRKRKQITPPDSAEEDGPSPPKKRQTSSETQTPSKAPTSSKESLKRQESAQRKEWKEEWARLVTDWKWEKDHSLHKNLTHLKFMEAMVSQVLWPSAPRFPCVEKKSDR